MSCYMRQPQRQHPGGWLWWLCLYPGSLWACGTLTVSQDGGTGPYRVWLFAFAGPSLKLRRKNGRALRRAYSQINNFNLL